MTALIVTHDAVLEALREMGPGQAEILIRKPGRRATEKSAEGTAQR